MSEVPEPQPEKEERQKTWEEPIRDGLKVSVSDIYGDGGITVHFWEKDAQTNEIKTTASALFEATLLGAEPLKPTTEREAKILLGLCSAAVKGGATPKQVENFLDMISAGRANEKLGI